MIKLSNRLSAVASFIETGSAVADIGTDHAYLPIWLAINNLAFPIISTDIKEGPVNKAKLNIASYGLSDKIKVIKTNGLCGVEDFSPDVIVIAGMGGELIRDIIKDMLFVSQKKVRLILQPMTRTPILRRFLYDNGFDIIGEKLAYDDRIYEIICSEFDGKKHIYNDLDLLVGKKNIEEYGELLGRHIDYRLEVLKLKTEGYKRASLDTSADDLLTSELIKLKDIL